MIFHHFPSHQNCCVCASPYYQKGSKQSNLGSCVVITHVHVSFLICSVSKQFSKTWSPTSTRKTNPVNLPTTTVRRDAAVERTGSAVLKTYLGSLINWKPLSLIWNHYFFCNRDENTLGRSKFTEQKSVQSYHYHH